MLHQLDWSEIIIAIIGFATSFWAYQMRQYHKSVNSKLDKFLLLVKSSAKAEGILIGAEQEKQRQKQDKL